jgi:hypothetical chaperone protein
MNTVGLDFGTSNSSIARVKDGRIQLFTLDAGAVNPRMLRSFIYVTRAHESFVGTAAIDKYQELETGRPVHWATEHMGEVQMIVASTGSSPIVYWDDLFIQVDTAARGRLIQSIKSALRIPNYDGTKIFDQFYEVETLIAILLRELRETSEAEIGEPVEGVVLGRPVKFSDDPEIDAQAQTKIEAAARLAGFKAVEFEYEPVAAALVHHRQTKTQEAALVFDFGGGTLDMTVINIGGGQAPQVLANHGVLLGGDDLDRALLRPLKRHFGEGARLRNRQPLPAHLMGKLDHWQTMVHLSRPEYRSLLNSARRGTKPLAIERLQALVNRNLGFHLFQTIELAKIELSSQATAPIEIDREGLKLTDMFNRPQFERLIQPELEQVGAALDEVLRQSGLGADQIDAVLRTGGSAEIPAFVRLLSAAFGRKTLRPLNPFETIVGGLAIRATEVDS